MQVIKLMGGLGNQMFQYAYGLYLRQLGFEVYFDSSLYNSYTIHEGFALKNLNIKESDELTGFSLNIANKVAFYFINYKIKSLKIVTHKNMYNTHIRENSYHVGYFQSFKYFEGIESILKETFTIKSEKSEYFLTNSKLINSFENSISIHIRRGDYTLDRNIDYIGLCSLSYYYNALNFLKEGLNTYEVFIFSDDLIWVKENFKGTNFNYLSNPNSNSSYEDLKLMSLCKNNIISNSTFSWWAAWLNSDENKKIIAPKTWFKNQSLNNQYSDIIPEDWIKI